MLAQPSAGTLTPAPFVPSPRLGQDCWFSEPKALGLQRPKSTSAQQPLEGLRSCRLAHCCVPVQVLRTQLQARRTRSQLQGETGRHRTGGGGGAGVCWDGHRLRHDGAGAGTGQHPAEVSSPRMVRMTALHRGHSTCKGPEEGSSCVGEQLSRTDVPTVLVPSAEQHMCCWLSKRVLTAVCRGHGASTVPGISKQTDWLH